jgi:hypothetical protein
VLEVGGFLKTTGLRAGAQRAFSSSSSDIGADERSIQNVDLRRVGCLLSSRRK